jgi:DNA-binding response OmpR family regulator
MTDIKTSQSVFIVDDDTFLTDMYSVKFLEHNFKVDVATSCTEAITKLSDGLKPDVILLDMVMPGMTGLDFLAVAKERNLLEGKKIIILSNLGQKEDVEKGLKAGADDYVVKANFTPSEVVEKVNTILGKK